MSLCSNEMAMCSWKLPEKTISVSFFLQRDKNLCDFGPSFLKYRKTNTELLDCPNVQVILGIEEYEKPLDHSNSSLSLYACCLRCKTVKHDCIHQSTSSWCSRNDSYFRFKLSVQFARDDSCHRSG